MTSLISAVQPFNRWDHSIIQPGPVGSVGDCLLTPRLKSSLPGNFNWDAEYYGDKEPLYGSSVSDGSYLGFNSGGGPARTLDTNWGGRRQFRTSHGWMIQDLRAPDKTIVPEFGPLPQYSWRNQIATVNNARSTGDLFLPLPTVGPPTDGLPRGGQFPRITDTAGGNDKIGITHSRNPSPPQMSSAVFPSTTDAARATISANRRDGRAGVLGRFRQ